MLNFWATGAINKAYERDLSTGYFNNQFCPAEPISWAQAIAVFAKAEKLVDIAYVEYSTVSMLIGRRFRAMQ